METIKVKAQAFNRISGEPIMFVTPEIKSSKAETKTYKVDCSKIHVSYYSRINPQDIIEMTGSFTDKGNFIAEAVRIYERSVDSRQTGIYLMAMSDTHYIDHNDNEVLIEDMPDDKAGVKIYFAEDGIEPEFPKGFSSRLINNKRAVRIIEKTRQDIGNRFCVERSVKKGWWENENTGICFEEAERLVNRYRRNFNADGQHEYQIRIL